MKSIVIATIALLFAVAVNGFAPIPQTLRTTDSILTLKPAVVVMAPSSGVVLQDINRLPHAVLRKQRKSVASVQTAGLFGLGVPEIAIILIAAAFLLGPQKLAELGKDAGKIAGELKEVPKEFQKGLQEGETRAKELKAASTNADTTSIADVSKTTEETLKKDQV